MFALISVLAIAGTLLPTALVAPADAGAPPGQGRIVRSTGTIVRKIGSRKVTFKVMFVASEWKDNESVVIIVTRKQTAGASTFTERHYWSARLEPGSVIIARDLKSASINTGDQLGDWGVIEAEFSSTGARSKGCGSHVEKRPGDLSKPPAGTFNFKTGNPEFGALKSVPEKAFAFQGNPFLCRGSVEAGACPPEEKSFYGQGYTPSSSLFFDAYKEAGAEKALISMTSNSYGLPEGRSASVSAAGTIPADRLRIKDDLDPAALDLSGNVPFLSGQASLANSEPVDPNDPETCGSGKEVRRVQRSGSIEGFLEMKVTGLRTFVFDQELDEVGVVAQKLIVENGP
jgi:hypothetical protein